MKRDNKKEAPEGTSLNQQEIITEVFPMQVRELGEFTVSEVTEAVCRLEQEYLRMKDEKLQRSLIVLEIRDESKTARISGEEDSGFFYCRGFLRGFFELGWCEVLLKQEYPVPVLDRKSYHSFSKVEVQEKLEQQKLQNN
jgi:hypothetical protein